MKNSIKVAKELVKIAKCLVSSNSRVASNATVDEITKLLMESIKNFDSYYFMQMPSGRWLCMQEDEQDGVKFNSLFLNTRVDYMGQPYGLMCEFFGDVDENSTQEDCRNMAEWILKEDAEFQYGYDITAEQFYKEYIEDQNQTYFFDLSAVQQHKQEFMDLVNKKGGNVYKAIEEAGQEMEKKYIYEQED